MAKYAKFHNTCKMRSRNATQDRRDEQKQTLTETSIGVLSLDALTPVLAKEHVCGEGTLGCVAVFLALARGLLSGGLASRLRAQKTQCTIVHIDAMIEMHVG